MSASLATTYLDLDLRTPLVAAPSPLTGDLSSLRALEAAGISAVVLPSLFEEQLSGSAWAGAARTDAAPTPGSAGPGPRGALRHLEAARAALSVPVIASLNGSTPGGWLRYARMLEESGADAIELNIYRIAADVATSGRLVEAEVIELVQEVRDAVTVPVAVKLGPYFSAFAHLAQRLSTAGANGLVLFNRFYQPDIDLESLTVSPRLVLSTPEELRLPLRWIALLHGRLPELSLAATTGVHSGRDVAKALLAGADVTMLASALLRNGPFHLSVMEEELRIWMAHHDLTCVEELKGAVSAEAIADPSASERAGYLRTLDTYAGTFG